MSKALRTVATVAGVVALAATGIGALGSAGVLSLSAGTASTLSTVATVASAVSVGAGTIAQLTAKKPGAQGSATQTMIGPDQPTPCILGRTYYAGNRMHDVGYGGEVSDVQNPYRALVDVYSIGPIQSIEALQTDFSTVTFSGGAATGWFDGFLYVDTQLGACPEASALTGHWGAIPQWGSSYKLSGLAAVLWSAKFDKKAKRFASGLPALGGIFKGVLCYDPRKDSTYPGGSGSHRIDDPATWEWSECPGLHGLKYVLGTWQNGKRVFGIGLEPSQFLIEDFVELANVSDARGWTIGGIVFEPGNRWENLKNILAAGGAEPCFKNARLGVRVNAPRVAVDVITRDDLTEGEITVAGMLPWAERKNTIVPKYRSAAHKWEYVPGDKVQVADYLTEDGEEKADTRQFNLVQDVDQAAQLAALELINSREKGPISFTGKSRLRRYPAGVKLIVDLPEAGLDAQPCILTQRAPDPGDMSVAMTLTGETESKYAVIEAVTGVAPPPIVLPTPEELDGATPGELTDESLAIRSAYVKSWTGADLLLGSDAGDGSATITIADHIWDYGGEIGEVARFGGTVEGLDYETRYYVYFDDETLVETDPLYQVTTTYADALNSSGAPYRHILGYVDTPVEGGASSGGGSAGGGYCPTEDTPILLANADRTGPGVEIAAGNLTTSDWVWTRPEMADGSLGAWGAWRVSAVSYAEDQAIYAIELDGRELRATAGHRVWRDGWARMDELGAPDRRARVVRISVAGAQTYVASGVISHNLKPTPGE